jgi:hypothetical protein
MANQTDLSRSLVAFEQDSTIIAVIEMSLNSWLVAGIVPRIERHPLKKLSCDEQMLLQLLYRWRDEAAKAGRDGFRLARWLRARGIEAYVKLLKRAFLSWLRGEPDHCSRAAIPSLQEEDAKRPTRERENLVGERTHRQSDEGVPSSLRHPEFQPDPAQSDRTAECALHAGSRVHAATQRRPSSRFTQGRRMPRTIPF